MLHPNTFKAVLRCKRTPVKTDGIRDENGNMRFPKYDWDRKTKRTKKWVKSYKSVFD